MSRLGEHRQASRGDVALHEHRRVNTRLVFVPDHDKCRDREIIHPVLEVEEGRPLYLDTTEGVGCADRGVLRKKVAEFLPALGVLALELDAGWASGVIVGHHAHALGVETLGVLLSLSLPSLGAHRAAASGSNDKGTAHLRMGEAEVQDKAPAHREPSHMGLLDA